MMTTTRIRRLAAWLAILSGAAPVATYAAGAHGFDMLAAGLCLASIGLATALQAAITRLTWAIEIREKQL